METNHRNNTISTRTSYFQNKSPQVEATRLALSAVGKLTRSVISQSSEKLPSLQVVTTTKQSKILKEPKSLRDRINERLSQKQNISSEINKQKQVQDEECQYSHIQKMLFSIQPDQTLHNQNVKQQQSIIKQKKQKQLLQFQQRQQLTLKLKKAKHEALREQCQMNKMKQCTFQPKLTKYIQL